VIGGLRQLLARHTAARFMMAGVANTAFGFVVYSAAIFAWAPVWGALLAGVAAGMVFNYVTIGGYAFRQLSWRRFPRFVLCYAAVYLTNLLLIELLSRHGLGAILAQALVTVPLAVLAYLMMRFMVFTGSRRVMSTPDTEAFKPVSVRAPGASRWRFALRCVVDLQLTTIVKPLRPALAQFPPGKVLDVGAGQAPWRGWLPAHCRYVGLDVDHAGDFGMSRGEDITYYDGKIIPFPPQCFDSALCVEVLEHTEKPDRLIAEIARVLKPGAPLLLTVPWSARRHHIPFDFHRFTRERLEAMLSAHGFTDVVVDERGDDIAVIANKLLVLTIRVLKSVSLKNFPVTLPFALLSGVLASVMLGIAHVSLVAQLGGREDPLGYFCSARKRVFHECPPPQLANSDGLLMQCPVGAVPACFSGVPGD
jgi:putative flippase GtrA/SAM-dependent methyltransferase